MARNEKEILGILPMIWVKSRIFGNTLASMPYQDYGGIAATSRSALQALLAQARHIQSACGAHHLELRHCEPICAPEARLRQDKVTLMLDISPGAGSLWKAFSSKVRNQIRKAEKSGLATHTGGAELLEDFYNVFAANMRDLGSPVHSPKFFAQIFSELGNNVRLAVVRHHNRTVGGLVILFHGDTAIVPWASSLREYFSRCPNNLLYWHALQLSCDRGSKLFDFGRSSIGSGTYNFKIQWGAKPVQLNWQIFSQNRKVQAYSPSEDARLRQASKIWSCLPLALTRLVGPAFRKYIIN